MEVARSRIYGLLPLLYRYEDISVFELGQCTTLSIFLIFSTIARSSTYHQICSTDLKRIHLYLRYTKRPYFSITIDLISLLYVGFIYLLFHVFLSW